MSERITVSEAAEILGMCEPEVRLHMRRGTLDIGLVLPPKTKGGNRTYVVLRPKLEKVLGKGIGENNE